MLLTISTTHEPATDLGYLLHKHPERVQEFPQSFGRAVVFYPEATEQRCTAALLLQVDPTRPARRRGPWGSDFSLAQHVNDRSYAASSLLAVALADVFGTARSGRCRSRQELADSPIPLRLEIPALPCRDGPDLAERFFGPLGWTVEATPVPLDERFPEWGDSRYVRLELTGEIRLADALNQLHVLLPALDESKHYWQGSDEVDKLLHSGGSWLAGHPERELVTRRYLGRGGGLATAALARLAEIGDDLPEPEQAAEDAVAADDPAEAAARRPLRALRREAVLGVVEELGAASVIDLGCGQGELLAALSARPEVSRVTGVDVSSRSLEVAERRLGLDRMGERQAARLTLFQGALTYRDERFAGYDLAVLIEVVEHVDPPRLEALERVVFGEARPHAVVVTTPNREHNVRYPALAATGGLRHPDHRFEWTRAEFADWCARVGAAWGYAAEIRGVGDHDPEVGPPTQLAVLRRG